MTNACIGDSADCYIRRDGTLRVKGLGDKADRWSRVLDGARAIATGSRHSVAIRTDGALWAWGEGFGIEPRSLLEEVVAVAAGNTATIALRADGSLLQWDGGAEPRRLRVQRRASVAPTAGQNTE